MLRSRHDREIFRLAVPALGALAAEPTYLLVDTAIVGHLGTTELAALALAAAALGIVVNLSNFLAYGTTAQVARLHGAGEERVAGFVAAQALWLSIAIGLTLTAVLAVLAAPIATLLNGDGGPEADAAARYLRLSALGLPFALIALAGQGYLRGVGDLRSPLVVLVAANAANVVLELLFVYGLGWGLDGSAIGTVIAQAGMGAAFVWMLLRAPASTRRPSWARIRSLLHVGGFLLVRTGALLACFTLGAAVAARFGAVPLAANQIAFQLFVFLALVLDAIAIAGQVLIGRRLGAGDAEDARAAARRMLGWAFVVGCVMGLALLAGRRLIPDAFTEDDAVVDAAADLWPLFALTLPAGAVVFALDGVLIGAGDVRFLAGAMVFAAGCFLPFALLADDVTELWIAFNVLMLARLVPLGVRFRGGRWLRTGAGSAV